MSIISFLFETTLSKQEFLHCYSKVIVFSPVLWNKHSNWIWAFESLNLQKTRISTSASYDLPLWVDWIWIDVFVRPEPICSVTPSVSIVPINKTA